MVQKLFAQIPKIMVCVLLILMTGVFSSCDKQEEIFEAPQVMNQEEEPEVSSTSGLRSTTTEILGDWRVSNSTPTSTENLIFFAQTKDKNQLEQGIKLKIFYHGWTQSINPEYVDMTWDDNVKGYYCQKRLNFIGKVSFRFVDGEQVTQNLTSSNKQILVKDNINWNFNGITKLHWPFGWDGSTNSDRGKWSAYRLTHTTGKSAETEFYAQDWNWGSGSQDLDRSVCSPFFGRVTFAGVGKSTYGNIVDVETEYNGRKIRARFAHLNRILVSVGDYVGPYSYVGTIGSSGGNFNPHLHLAINEIFSDGRNKKSLQFNFER